MWGLLVDDVQLYRHTALLIEAFLPGVDICSFEWIVVFWIVFLTEVQHPCSAAE